MKKFFFLLACLVLTFSAGCEEPVEEGTLYTSEDIFLDCIKTDYGEPLPSKIIVIENEEQLNSALEQYVQLIKLPRFEEIMTNYPIDENVYVVHFIQTRYASQTVSCDGIMVDKQNGRIWFKCKLRKKKTDTFGVVAGYIAYAVFPKEELEGCDFSKQGGVIYPGN